MIINICRNFLDMGIDKIYLNYDSKSTRNISKNKHVEHYQVRVSLQKRNITII